MHSHSLSLGRLVLVSLSDEPCTATHHNEQPPWSDRQGLAPLLTTELELGCGLGPCKRSRRGLQLATAVHAHVAIRAP